MIQIPDQATLKACKAKIDTDSNGDGVLLIKVPGTVGTVTRLIEGAKCWFDNPVSGDYIEFYISDEDNILGYGAGTVVGSYTETALTTENQGWYFPPNGWLNVEAIAGFGRLVAGFYIKAVVKKGSAVVDTFRANIHWGEAE